MIQQEIVKIFNDYKNDITQTPFLQVKTNNKQIFLCDIKYLKYIRKYIWSTSKFGNNNYVYTTIDNKHVFFYRLIHSEWQIVDYINQDRLDNRECNLRESYKSKNAKNRKLCKGNNTGINGLSYNSITKKYSFYWWENNKSCIKNFNTKDEQLKVFIKAIKFKIKLDKKLNNTSRTIQIQPHVYLKYI
ncbi:hypothetical protein C2G38_2221935 [Gigaspora rosea]|uniref:HNH nuclease domain-containing protein n=1 Tax=Gigaspora rosea TaxID=44941 RepID=A0A397UBC0_9GLOM|nr:hypothetical protein C2G38_2221935 [Gigaspora rosea]